ncbi:DUF2971 domain-containing protein [Rhodobacteraceae bacterium CH30]|nr:DUF2971 domain-containing protein [Rhodobacteraceae bacterium CH30]
MSASDPAEKDLMAERELLLKSSIPVYLFQPVCLPGDDRLSKLEQGWLWMSDPGKFNDLSDLKLEIKDLTYRGPFDDRSRLQTAICCLMEGNSSLNWYSAFDADTWDGIRRWVVDGDDYQLVERFKARFRQFGVACFTSDWRNRLMWAHYANSHQGFCIEYSVKKMQMKSDSVNPFDQYQVQYVSEVSELCLSELLFSPHQAVGRYLATKHVDWAYEKEWRLVSFEHQGKCAPMPKGMQISALIAGRRMSVESRVHLQKTASRLGVPALKIVDKHGKEALEPFEEVGSA